MILNMRFQTTCQSVFRGSWSFGTQILGLLSVGQLALSAETKIEFNRDIRPILSGNCYECHGPDAAQRKGGNDGLRLDTQAGAFEDLGDGAAILPGDPEASLLIQRIMTQDPDDKMPPPESGKQISDAELGALKEWIQQGAPYQGHWAYEVPKRPQPPEPVNNSSKVVNAIDQFILAAAQKEGLQQSPQAERYALARRAALDLTGLPPTVEEADAFAADTDVQAYEKYIDHLLEKDAFGEHWARAWLDQARYADSAGYADDPPRTIWGYRDYVIQSFNKNKPFDQFTIEQLAGDLLENPGDEQLVATAFHRNTMTNSEGGTDDEEFRNVAVVDRVTTTWAVWMGTTMTCAQCHNHKYDPISQEDFFKFFALLNQTADADRRDERPLVELFTEEQKAHRKSLESGREQLKEILATPTAELLTAKREWETMLGTPPNWHPLTPSNMSSSNGTQLSQGAHSVITAKNGKGNDRYTIEFTFEKDSTFTGLKLEALTDATLPKQGPGMSDGQFVLTDLNAKIIPPSGTSMQGQFVRVSLKGGNKILSLAEVQVFQGEENLARKGKATQSTTDFGGPPELAIDGNTNGHFSEAKSTTHTSISSDPWWELDLGKSQSIDRIAIWNRTDGNIQDRLKGALVELLDADRKVVWTETLNPAPEVSAAFELDGSQSIQFSAAHADFSQSGLHASNLIKKEKSNGWGIAPRVGESHQLTLLAASTAQIPAGSRLSVELVHASEQDNAKLGAFRLSMTSDSQAVELAQTPLTITGLINTPPEDRTTSDEKRLMDYYLTIAPSLDDERNRLAEIEKEIKEIKPYTTVPVLQALAPDKQRETRIQRRGNFLDLGDLVEPGLPEIFEQNLDQKPTDRLSMARWLVSRENPLTARVLVNRMWESMFGTGLVRSSEEFGAQGDLPSHPELLDWLAVEFMDSGWDFKHMLKLMVTSATYRQSSRVTPELLEQDPDNRWLARGPRVRLSAESIRDQALFVSGLLSDKMYGSSVNPPQPEMGLNAAFGGKIDWKTSEGEDRYRRGLYTTWRRSNPYPSMATFDAPNREVCILKRDRSNTPLQALVTLNDPAFVETAQALARRMTQAASHPEGRVEYGFRTCLTRLPSEAEKRELLKLYTEAYAAYVDQPQEARLMIEKPLGEAPEGADVRELAAWSVVANVLLNLDETLMKR